jgi:hypothetical protein
VSQHDPLIERTEEAGGGTRAAEAANLFDLRRIIGGVFLVWGVLLVLLGITESDEEIAKAADVNINLWAGLGMLAISAVFLTWAFTRPLGEELAEAEADHTGPMDAPSPRGVDASAHESDERRGGARDDRPGTGGGGGPRRE